MDTPQQQLHRLESAEIPGAACPSADFDADLRAHGLELLRPVRPRILQLNLGRLCNMACRHCHVAAGPDRDEQMDDATLEACLAALDWLDVGTVDLTGGAPELHPRFRDLVDETVARGRAVIDCCNLTVLLLPRSKGLPEWLAARGVEMVCSLPHHRKRNTDAQRGEGAYEKSIVALRLLNAAGYGEGHPDRVLTLVTNPAGAFLAGSQASLEKEWRASLERQHGVTFDRLIALNNMPIARFLEWLVDSDNLEPYLRRLAQAFNPAAAAGLMCRDTVSVSWDGSLYDCDFNQMLEIAARRPDGESFHVRDLQRDTWMRRQIQTARHCYGCTAGAGSSCGGATEG